MAGEFHEQAALRLRAAGQRYTRNRRAIVNALTEADHPMTIPEIVAVGEGLAMSSIYRNVSVLEASGVLHKVVTSDEFARYELAEDLTEHHHHHLICAICGTVEDFTLAPKLEKDATGALKRVATKAGFTVRSHRLDVVGVCARCS